MTDEEMAKEYANENYSCDEYDITDYFVLKKPFSQVLKQAGKLKRNM